MKKLIAAALGGAVLGYLVREYEPEIERGVLALRRRLDLWLIKAGYFPLSRDDHSYYPPPGY